MRKHEKIHQILFSDFYIFGRFRFKYLKTTPQTDSIRHPSTLRERNYSWIYLVNGTVH